MDTAFVVLWDSSLRAAIMVIGVMIILRALRVKSPSVLHRAWTGVLVAMLALPVISSWAPRIPVPILPPVTAVVPIAPDVQPASSLLRVSPVSGSPLIVPNTGPAVSDESMVAEPSSTAVAVGAAGNDGATSRITMS